MMSMLVYQSWKKKLEKVSWKKILSSKFLRILNEKLWNVWFMIFSTFLKCFDVSFYDFWPDIVVTSFGHSVDVSWECKNISQIGKAIPYRQTQQRNCVLTHFNIGPIGKEVKRKLIRRWNTVHKFGSIKAL